MRDPDNNYRMYTIDDVRTMNTIRELIGLGFSTEEILRFEQDRNLRHVTEMLEKEDEIISEQLNRLERKRENIRGRLKSIKESQKIQCTNEIVVRDMPERKCLKITDSEMPAGKYLSCSYHGDFSNTKTIVPKMQEYAREHGLTITGDPIEFCYIDRYETSVTEEYLTEIQIPVR